MKLLTVLLLCVCSVSFAATVQEANPDAGVVTNLNVPLRVQDALTTGIYDPDLNAVIPVTGFEDGYAFTNDPVTKPARLIVGGHYYAYLINGSYTGVEDVEDGWFEVSQAIYNQAPDHWPSDWFAAYIGFAGGNGHPPSYALQAGGTPPKYSVPSQDSDFASFITGIFGDCGAYLAVAVAACVLIVVLKVVVMWLRGSLAGKLSR